MKLNELTESYIKIRDSEIIPELYQEAVDEAAKWLRMQKKIIYDEVPKSFPEEVALEFISRAYEGMITNVPYYVLLSIARALTSKYVYSRGAGEVSASKVTFDNPDERLVLEEFLSQQLEGLSVQLQSILIYLLVFPEELRRIRKLYKDDSDFYVGMVRLYRVKQKLAFADFDFSVWLPKTQAAKALLLSSLYKLHPGLLVLFLLVGDVSKFLQFCWLFEGQSVSVPTVHSLLSVVESCSSLASKLERGEIFSESERKDLALLCSEAESVSTSGKGRLTPFLEIYLRRTIDSLGSEFKKFHSRVVRGMDICDSKEVVQVYRALSKELDAEFSVFNNIIELLDRR